MKSHLVEINRLPGHAGRFPHIKDPSVVRVDEESWALYASLGGGPEPGGIGRFTARHPGGPYEEEGFVSLEGVTGHHACAPSVAYDSGGPGPHWEMHVQNACFSNNCVIAHAVSDDGIHFEAAPKPAMTRHRIRQTSPCKVVKGVYDVAVTRVGFGGADVDCMVFAGYRKVGSGDLYMSQRRAGTETWDAPSLLLRQEDVPFHNRPDAPGREWGLEGGKIDEIRSSLYLLTGVCFLPPDIARRKGTRQRAFCAAARSLEERFTPLGVLIEPLGYAAGTGENGHPDTVDLGDRMGFVYQERAGKRGLWHLRYAEAGKDELCGCVDAMLKGPAPEPRPPVLASRLGI